MHFTLLLPGVLLPREVAGALAGPLARTHLSTLLTRAELVGDSETQDMPHLAWLAEHLFHRPAPLATAPYAYAALAGEPLRDAVLWHADPVHLELARDHLVVAPLPAPPSEAEAGALIEAADALAAAVGAQFLRAGDRWFLRVTRRWNLDAQPLSAVIGAPLQAARPEGDDARAWNRLLTEIQMTWHTHPVNERREAGEQQTINSVWLHGGGTWSPLPRPGYAAVLADAAEWRGAAQAASLPAAAADAPPADGALLVVDSLLPTCLQQDWPGWIRGVGSLDARLAELAQSGTLDLVLTGGRTVRRLRTRPSNRLKFWRTRNLEQLLSE